MTSTIDNGRRVFRFKTPILRHFRRVSGVIWDRQRRYKAYIVDLGVGPSEYYDSKKSGEYTGD